jgi:hypothetical protein
MAPKKSIRPKARPEGIEYDGAVERGNRAADREGADKMAKGGMCRGMGAAKRGGSYKG